jgi:hypothetical protein
MQLIPEEVNPWAWSRKGYESDWLWVNRYKEGEKGWANWAAQWLRVHHACFTTPSEY